MENFEIKIKPNLGDYWSIAFDDSYRYGLEKGVIYTPRFFNREQGEDWFNNFESLIPLDITHETIHKWLLENEGEETSKALDNIDKDKSNLSYLITDIKNWSV